MRDVLSPQFGMDIDHASGLDFTAQFDLLTLPGARINRGCSAASGARTRERLTDGDDSVALMIALETGFVIEQGGTDTFIAPGKAMLVDWRAPFAVCDLEPSKWISVLLPHRATDAAVTGLDNVYGRLLPPSSTTALLAGYLNSLLAISLPDASLASVSSRHICDLAILIIGAGGDAAELATRHGLRAARLDAIKAYMTAHLGCRDLTIDRVAARHGLTRRYVQRLFETQGTNFSADLLEQRLCRAHALLRQPQAGGAAISLVAYQCGFGEVSYFNRAFRKRFGATPSDVRTCAIQQATRRAH